LVDAHSCEDGILHHLAEPRWARAFWQFIVTLLIVGLILGFCHITAAASSTKGLGKQHVGLTANTAADRHPRGSDGLPAAPPRAGASPPGASRFPKTGAANDCLAYFPA
jgi:hypothetical protein